MPPGRQFGGRSRPYAAIALAAAAFLGIAVEHTEAHKPVTSKYDYNKDIFPLFREYCSRCHVSGGAAPMSLMTYNDAVPWAESIRDEVSAGRMPPWPVDATSPAVQSGYPISAREIDQIVVWASGGTPEGDPGANLPEVAYKAQWNLGPPDLKIPMDAEHTMAPDATEESCEYSLPTNVTQAKWVKAADLMPGNSSIVRDAVISIENGPVLALWQPGTDTIATPTGTAFALPPGSKIHLRIHYKKHFDQGQKALSDKSTIGLYFTDAPSSGHGLQSLVIDPPKASGDPAGSSAFGGALPAAARIVAFRPTLDRGYASLNIDAVTPSGARVPLLRLHGPRPQWLQRYWLRDPVQVDSGSKIEVQLTPLADDSDEPPMTKKSPLQVAIDYVAQ